MKMVRKEFDWAGFEQGKIQLQIDTHEAWDDFAQQADERGWSWLSGSKLTELNYVGDANYYGGTKDKEIYRIIDSDMVDNSLEWREYMPKMQFEVGDKVKYDGYDHKYCPEYFPECGTTGTIKIANLFDCLVQWANGSTSGDDFWWADYKHLELVKEEKPTPKSLLKVGYVVKRRDGEYRMVMPSENGLIIVGEGDWISICDYNDELNYDYKSGEYAILLDIVEIYGFNEWQYQTLNVSSEDRPLIWKREEPVVEPATELTISEIEKRLGVKNLKVVKEVAQDEEY